MYYFLTRIVQPLLVAPEQPRYDHRLNEVAARIAAVCPDFEGLGHLVAFVFQTAYAGSLPMICLTFDTDYAGGEDIRRFLAKYPIPGTATFFVVYAGRVAWGGHEVEPHPFFKDGEPWEETMAAWEAAGSPFGPAAALLCNLAHPGKHLKRRGYPTVPSPRRSTRPGSALSGAVGHLRAAHLLHGQHGLLHGAELARRGPSAP